MSELFLDEALSAAARSWRVFPVHTIRNGHCSCLNNPNCKPGKHPIGRLAPNGRDSATCDPMKIATWWSEFPDANVGIATGQDSGIVVIDIDPGHGGEESLAEFEILHGHLPQTAECITGSGGRHIYFRYPGCHVPSRNGVVAPGIDIKADGGYVIGPPSRHISGGQYTWEISSHPDEVPLADIPQWLLTLIVGLQPNMTNQSAVTPGTVTHLPVSKDAYRFVAEGAPIGEQRQQAIKAARSYLGNGYTITETIKQIWKGLQACEQEQGKPEWTEQDATKIVNDLASKPAPPPIPLNKPQPHRGAPTIYASCPDLATVTSQCWGAIATANVPTPHYFRHGGIPSRIEADDQDGPVIREMTTDRLRHEMARIASWKRKELKKDGTWSENDARPPLDVMKDILATPNPPLPVLTRIVEVPVFAADGTLQMTPGYHQAARTYYSPAPGLTIPDVPEDPSVADIDQARTWIMDMIVDFPFVADADRAHAIALLLLPFVRDMIPGPTPNHLIEAPTAGCGKGLLADCLLTPAAGIHVGIVTNPKDEDEFRKRLTAQLKEGRAAVLLDNVTQLDSATLAAVLTAPTWDDRVLGKTEMLSLAVRCAWVTTANNPTMSTEIARRCVRIRLDPMQDRPWQREGFKHTDLRGWTQQYRGELAAAALTLTRAWLVAGKPATAAKPLGSYERWTEVIGGILEYAGIAGFLANLNEFYEASDLEGTIWRQFVETWWGAHQTNEVGTAALFPLAQSSDLFDLGKGGERSQRITFGKLLSRQRDRVIGEHRIVRARTIHKLTTWRLLPSDKRGMLGMLGDVSIPPPTREKSNEKYSGGENIPFYTQHTPPLPLFTVTDQWRVVPDGYMLPNGCEIRMDSTTGKNFARLDPRLQQPIPDPFLAAMAVGPDGCYYQDYEDAG